MIGKKAEFAIFLERNEEAEQRKGKKKKKNGCKHESTCTHICVYIRKRMRSGGKETLD